MTQIRFNKHDQKLILSVDVNYGTNRAISYKDINEIIDINNSVIPKSRIERSHQTLGAISLQLRKTIMNLIRKELDFTREKGRNA